MSLSPEEIDRLRQSFREFARDAPAATLAFYDRLFEIAPETRPLFSGDMELQGVKMMNTLGVVVAQIHDQAALAAIVGDLARRHVAYGVRPDDYAKVGEALLWAVHRALGDRCTPDLVQTWSRAYGSLADAMIQASETGNGPVRRG